MNNAKPGDVVTLNGKAYEATQIEGSKDTCYGCAAFNSKSLCASFADLKPCLAWDRGGKASFVIWKDQEQLRECRKAQAFCDGLLRTGHSEEAAIKYTMNHLAEWEYQKAEQTHQECETAQSYFELLVQSGFTDEWATYHVMLWLAEKEFTKG